MNRSPATAIRVVRIASSFVNAVLAIRIATLYIRSARGASPRAPAACPVHPPCSAHPPYPAHPTHLARPGVAGSRRLDHLEGLDPGGPPAGQCDPARRYAEVLRQELDRPLVRPVLARRGVDAHDE